MPAHSGRLLEMVRLYTCVSLLIMGLMQLVIYIACALAVLLFGKDALTKK